MLFGGALVTAPFLAAEQQLEFWLVVLAGTLGTSWGRGSRTGPATQVGGR